MRVAKRMIPFIIVVLMCLSVILSRKQVVVEFNTGMPVQNIEGLRNALDSLLK